MSESLRSANINSSEVNYINAHGTSTPFNDKIETLAIKKVFNKEFNDLFVSSSKSMLGHLLGAAGAVEAIITIKALQTGILPPTINYNTPDPDCDLNYIPNKAIEKNINYALSNAFGFGGHNASLLFKKFN